MSKVSEVAEICGVSEQAVRKLFAQLGLRKLRNQWNPTKEQLELVFSHYGVTDFPQPVATNATKVAQPTQPGSEGVSADDARWYREQIEALNQRCEELTKLLDQEQQLHAATKQELALLQAPQADAASDQPKPWWRFWG